MNENINDKILIAGPCSAESETQVMETAEALKRAGVSIFRAGVWKPRTKPGGFEGVGSEALEWLRKAAGATGLRVAVEIATPRHLEEALEAGIRIFWIGARTTANPFAVQEIADALASLTEARRKELTVLVKNPVNPDLELWLGAIERIGGAGIGEIMAVHRGFSHYGPHIYRNEPHWAIPIELMRRRPDIKMICDPSHIGGERGLVAPLAQQAMDMNFDGLMVEVHPRPAEALSDSRQQLTPGEFSEMLGRLNIRREGGLGDERLKDGRLGDGRLGIEELRRRIDRIDDDLLRLIGKRMRISGDIGTFKREHGMAVVQPERYNSLMEQRVAEGEELGLRPRFVRRLLQLIHEESVSRQM